MELVRISVKGVKPNVPEPRIDIIPKPIPRPYNNNAFRLLILGSSGKGKSNIFVNLITRPEAYGMDPKLGGVFDRIYIFCPTYDYDTTVKVLTTPGPDGKSFLTEDAIFKNGDKESIEARITEIEDEIAKEIDEHNDESTSPIKTLIVFDDLMRELRDSEKLMNLCTKGRKLQISLILTAQAYKSFLPTMRTNMTHYCIFDSDTSKELNDIITDLPSDKERTKELFKRVFKSKPDLNPFITVVKHANPEDMFWYKLGGPKYVDGGNLYRYYNE